LLSKKKLLALIRLALETDLMLKPPENGGSWSLPGGKMLFMDSQGKRHVVN
jgi:uncharacterized membrane protein